jgi:NAD(P)-dependent dehydrogenase (short-subunit alcohol dehydrogenase family)
MNRLKDKVAIVTGAARGLGRATAVRMAEEGGAVAVLDLHDEVGAGLVMDP